MVRYLVLRTLDGMLLACSYQLLYNVIMWYVCV
jgi:hypothetical protein